MQNFKTNDFLDENLELVGSDFKTQREENFGVYIEFFEDSGVSFGCVFTLKKKGLHQCKGCRQIIDKDERKNGKSGLNPAAFRGDQAQIRCWVQQQHHAECMLKSFGTWKSKSFKNMAVIHKAKLGGTSKAVYDGFQAQLTSSNDVSIQEIERGYGTFNYSKNALNKSGKRKIAAKNVEIMDENNKIRKESTEILKFSQDEKRDFFLIKEIDDTGTIVLGCKYMVKRFFESTTVMSDGTFKIAPRNFTQVYILWFVVEDLVEGEEVARNKAFPAIYILMKTKTQSEYIKAMAAIECYRVKKHIQYPNWTNYLMDDERAFQNVLLATYPATKISLCLFHVNKNILKRMAKKRLSKFFKDISISDDETKWVYKKMKQLLALPFLKEEMITTEFLSIKSSVLDVMEGHLNAFQIDKINSFFESIGKYYFENQTRIPMLSKFNQTIRTTNLLESTHAAFNKSMLLNKNGSVSNLVNGLMQVDIEFRGIMSKYEDQGAKSFPKHKSAFIRRELKIKEFHEQLENKSISPQVYSEKISKLFIHRKYYSLLDAASDRIEAEEDENEIDACLDDFVEGILIGPHSGQRVRKLSKMYFG